MNFSPAVIAILLKKEGKIHSCDPLQYVVLQVGYPLESLFKECAFQGKKLNCSEIVTPYLDRNYGKCFLIDVKTRQTLAGQGLSLVLNIDAQYAFTDHPPLIEALSVKIDKQFDLAGYKKTMLEPESHVRINLDATKYNLIDRIRPFGGTQRCIEEKNQAEYLTVLRDDS